jgi:Fe-S-cluster containining protein
MAESEFDCQTCGACCVTYDVALLGNEIERFEADPRLRSLTVLHRGRTGPAIRLMQRERANGRCVALHGPLHRCACSIYAERPSLCAEFAPGSPDCLAARARLGGLAVAPPAAACGTATT